MTRIFALLFAAALPARAVETKAPLASAHSAAEATPQARAFLAFSEADRKAAQEALGWLGFYNGVDDGAFGKRTVEALSAYQRSFGGQADGIMTAKALAALKDGAAKAKAALGFRLIDDPATGARIGAPTKLLEKRESGAGTASLVSKDGTVGLYLKETKGDLAALYKALSADAGARKVTYKYLKPDSFFVTAGEEGDSKFYRRYAVGGDKLRGFAFVYPKKRSKALDPVALAIANTFDPFPATSAAPKPTPTPQGPKLVATAFIVAPGVAVTALDPAECKTPTVAGKPARYLPGGGVLVRLGGEFGANASAPPVAPGEGELVALSLRGGAPQPALAVSLARGAPGGMVIGAFAPSASGAPLFDRHGRLVGFVGRIKVSPHRAGVALAAPHAIIPASALGAGAAGEAGVSLTASEIARLRRREIIGVFCAA
jgi:hypothetical protein